MAQTGHRVFPGRIHYLHDVLTYTKPSPVRHGSHRQDVAPGDQPPHPKHAGCHVRGSAGRRRCIIIFVVADAALHQGNVDGGICILVESESNYSTAAPALQGHQRLGRKTIRHTNDSGCWLSGGSHKVLLSDTSTPSNHIAHMYLNIYVGGLVKCGLVTYVIYYHTSAHMRTRSQDVIATDRTLMCFGVRYH